MNSVNNTILVQSDDFNSHTVYLASVALKNGDEVKKEQIVAIVETSKKVIEVVSPFDGYIYFYQTEGEQFNVHEPLAVVSDVRLQEWTKPSQVAKEGEGYTLKAKRLAEKFHLQVSDFKGKTIIKEEDVITELKKRNIVYKSFEAQLILAEENLAPNSYVSSITVSLNDSKFQDYLRRETSALKKAVNADAAFVFAVHTVLKKYEKLTSFVDGNQLITLGECPVGLYISDEHKKGATYVVDGAHCSSLEKIVDRLYEVYRNYLNNDIETTIQRSAFYISNMMTMNVLSLSPMLKSGTVATLGIASPFNGQFNVTLAFDHRLMDGGYVARFLNDLKLFLEEQK